MASQNIPLSDALTAGDAALVAVSATRRDWRVTLGQARLLQRVGNLGLGLIVPALLLALWWWACEKQWLPANILPAPKVVLATFREFIASGELESNLAISLWRVAKGFALGSVLGLGLGFALGFSRTIDSWFGPAFRTLAQVPSLAWIPLLMQIFGIDETLKLVVMAKAALIPIAFTTANGVRNLPPAYLEVGKVLRLRKATMLLRVILPGALPSIFSGIRQGLAHVWVSLIIVEMLASAEGIGYLMSWGRTIFQLDIVMMGIIVIGVIGFLLDFSLKLLEGRLLRWRVNHG